MEIFVIFLSTCTFNAKTSPCRCSEYNLQERSTVQLPGKNGAWAQAQDFQPLYSMEGNNSQPKLWKNLSIDIQTKMSRFLRLLSVNCSLRTSCKIIGRRNHPGSCIRFILRSHYRLGRKAENTMIINDSNAEERKARKNDGKQQEQHEGTQFL